MTRQSERPAIPLQATSASSELPSAPVKGEANSALKTRLLQDFPDGRAPYGVADGPLDTPCWLWLGATHPKGYAMRWIDNRRVTVHREIVGPLNDDEDAHHRCHARRCVNPAHIERLTKADHSRLHRGGRTALDDALELLALQPRLGPAAISRFSGQSRKAVNQALRRAERRGVVRRVALGEYVLVEAST
jgi:hypothetical protein